MNAKTPQQPIKEFAGGHGIKAAIWRNEREEHPLLRAVAKACRSRPSSAWDEAILAEPGWTVRIMTKSAAVAKDFDLISRHRDRVLVGLSIAATPEMEDVMSAVEPNASPVGERIAALREAHEHGLRTYVMLCPLLPKVGDTADDIDQLVQLAADCDVEEIFAEPFGPCPGLRATEEALRQHGHWDALCALMPLRCREKRSWYVARQVRLLQQSTWAHFDISRLRFLLDPSRLTQDKLEEIRGDDAGVVWLRKERNAP